MTPQSIQLYKEVRQLFWPWTVLMLAGLLTLIPIPRNYYSWSPIDLLSWILPLGCFMAIPLLAALPLGSEFQYGTFSLTLVQPIDRRKLWLRKVLITVVAVFPPAILYLAQFGSNQEYSSDFWMAAIWVVASVSGAVAGTLIARSAIGGVALSGAFYGILFLIWMRLADSHRNGNHLSTGFLAVTVIALFGYSVGIVLLGRRMFLRYQSADGLQSANEFLPGAKLLPNTVGDWLRCRPRGVILNLIRREFIQLRVVWFLGLFSVAVWIFLVAFGYVKGNESDSTPPIAMATLLGLLIAILAGALSLGEEKTQDTHACQLTLPLSSWVQWSVKLFVALFASFVCAIGAPFSVLLVRGLISGGAMSYLDQMSVGHTQLWFWVFAALCSTLLAFWCACAVKGTVRAALFFFPVLVSLGLAATIGNWLASGVNEQAKYLVDMILSRLDLVRVNHFFAIALDWKHGDFQIISVMAGPLLAVGLIQAHRMFRAQMEDRQLYAIRHLVAPLSVFLAGSFLTSALFFFAIQLRNEQIVSLGEVHLAIETLATAPGTASPTTAHKFTLAELHKAVPLSEHTRTWLRDSTITVTAPASRPNGSVAPIQWPFEFAFPESGALGKEAVPYSATIRTSRGSECNLRFWASGSKSGLLFQSCQ